MEKRSSNNNNKEEDDTHFHELLFLSIIAAIGIEHWPSYHFITSHHERTHIYDIFNGISKYSLYNVYATR